MKRVHVIRRGSSLPLASRFSKRSGSRESIRPFGRLTCLKHEVSWLTLCPLGQPKGKAIGHERPIEPWLTRDDPSVSLAHVSETDPILGFAFPLLDLFRTVLAVQGSLRRADRRALDGSGPF